MTQFAREGYSGPGSWVLSCPHCDNDYLHHSSVVVWDRSEDENIVRETTVSVAVSTMMAPCEDTQNPSMRRNGMKISFWCETCIEDNQYKWLTISQHKGMTLLAWELKE